MPDHFFEADALDTFDADVEASLIFRRKEAFRHDHEEISRAPRQDSSENTIVAARCLRANCRDTS